MRTLVHFRGSLNQHAARFAVVRMDVTQKIAGLVSDAAHDVAMAVDFSSCIQLHGFDIALGRISIEALL